MQIKFFHFTLQLKHTFTISTYSRNFTPALLIEVEDGGLTGFGEISMPQYLEETPESAEAFLNKVNLSRFSINEGINEILDYINSLSEGERAVKAGLDIALHDLYGKYLSIPVRKIYNIEGTESPRISFTLGIDSADVLLQKMDEAERFTYLKLKLGSKNDVEIIETIRKVTDKKIIADINQGWKEKDYALEMLYYLKEKGVVAVEQPLNKNMKKEQEWLIARSPIPVFADESFQEYKDLEEITNLYNGVNIKLMKCGGIREAYSIIMKAKENKMQIMLGCMTETSCAISAAAQLSPLADYADLDGNLLIANDPFEGLKYFNGKIKLSGLPGLGVKKII